MAKNRKQVVLNGQTYERTSGKSGRYVNINNPDDSISRRQAETGELQQKGFKSFEDKAAQRKAAGIPKGFKEVTFKAYPKSKFYRKRPKSIEALIKTLKDIKEKEDETGQKFLSLVKYRGKIAKDSKTGLSLMENGHTLTVWRVDETGYGQANYYLEFVNFHDKYQELKEIGFLINDYEVIISPKPN